MAFSTGSGISSWATTCSIADKHVYSQSSASSGRDPALDIGVAALVFTLWAFSFSRATLGQGLAASSIQINSIDVCGAGIMQKARPTLRGEGRALISGKCADAALHSIAISIAAAHIAVNQML